MRFFVKAIATGFAMSLGSAMFKKVSDKMGLDNGANNDEATAMKTKGASEQDEDVEDVEDV